jgi:radical SAM protein (TIGR01212 family)
VSTSEPRTAPQRYRSLRPWLIETFGRPVHRVALDAGSDCPNRDGTKGRGGCVYCDVEGSGTGALRRGEELAVQLERGLARVARRDPGGAAIAYLQSYSNTYVDPARLDEVLGALEPFLDGRIAALSLATRPDTLPEPALARLERVRERIPVWIELGLECADDARLVEINRLHSVADYLDAARRAHSHGMLVVGHAILGLPGDGREGARRTAQVLAESAAEGVKVHHLMVLRRTALAHWWREGRVEPLTPELYVDWLADFVERLRPEQVLHRITGDAADEELLAPRWDVHKNEIRRALELELERRGTRQGEGRGSVSNPL